jgi:hypothetical protein
MRALLLFAIFATSVNAQTNTITFQSSATQTALLELYTSEGCSSCPLAETQLSRLKKSPGLWKDFVPVAFHVDYWDYLGWRDPWGSAEFSDRQRSYAAQWRSETVYTPGFVLNGREYRDWGRKEVPASSGTTAGVITATSTDRSHWQITFAPVNSTGGEYLAHAALLISGVASDVKAGENRGRRLNHDFIAVAFASARLAHEGSSLQGEIHFGSRPQSSNELALAVWVTKSGRLDPLQATGGWLH